MPNDLVPYVSGKELLSYLREVFGREVITTTELREFLNISPSTDQRMRASGQYPRTLALPGQLRDRRIMLIDLAAWLERGGCEEIEGKPSKKRGRGSEVWKRNHPKPEKEDCSAEA